MYPQRSFSIHRLLILRREIRLLSSDKKSSNNENNDNVKTKKTPKSSVIKVKDNERLTSLEKKVDSFKSIGPNDKNTINKMIAKPKIHVRQSARSKEKVEVKEDLEPMEVLARGLDKRLVDAARRVADRMPRHSARLTEKQLLGSIQKQRKETAEAAKKMMTVKEDRSESISYKILASKTEPKLSDDQMGTTSKVVRIKLPLDSTLDFDKSRPTRKRPISLFSNECLSIFDPKGIYLTDQTYKNSLWHKLTERELELFLERPPKNLFEEMIKLTDDGKLWQYPIDNEQGLDHEESVPFYDHVLLDNLLNEFPQRGPVRQFMELVLLGLSQNPYITVQRKRETIQFYKNFFEEKNLLSEIEDLDQ
ncbi:mitochondrial ribosomal protein S31 isoform X2 [Dermatophagoides farinae]|uniref:Small ribosomal subunit protein mS31 n=1 Tax=Dermatophagoides farinae TaxID=6954 RepID=A0A922LCI6_DERFA|nr:28S ribosomal protein S31, mitochondrial-like [Dermatophagoides farinae]KAH7642314.1 28s ribosomal protein s31 [Dermatophagoides farinae]KAH9529527.1 Structural constituent of ribosome [Dermatophagoides farinae]